MSKWSIHVCKLDKQCRSYDAPNRIYMNTPWFHFGVALTPMAKYAGRIKEPWLSEVMAVRGRSKELRERRREIYRRAEYHPDRWLDLHWKAKLRRK